MNWRWAVITLSLGIFSACAQEAPPPSASVPASSPVITIRGERVGSDWFLVYLGEAVRISFGNSTPPIEISGSQYGEYEAHVERLHASSLVIARRDTSYGFRLDSTKVFSDGRHLDFPAYVSVRQPTNTDGRFCFDLEAGIDVLGACVTNGQPVFTGEKRARDIQGRDIPISGPGDNPDPNVLAVPQSTYDDFARLRPGRVQDGYTREAATIDERMGPSQLAGERLWFGKQFYDGEGTTGVGGFGYFDTVAKEFTLFHPEAVVDWSVSAILVDGNTVWLGLSLFTEGAGGSGGLVQYDIVSQQTARYSLDDIVLNITRVSDSLYLGTSNGLYRFAAGRFTRHRFEPDVDRKYVVLTDEVAPSTR